MNSEQHAFLAIDHVQLAMPPGGEDAARRFFGGVLGMTEIAKPAELAKRGGCWFVSGGAQVHLGVEADFRPAKEAHPRCVAQITTPCLPGLKAAEWKWSRPTTFRVRDAVTSLIRSETGLNCWQTD
jgi:hypothetical protein